MRCKESQKTREDRRDWGGSRSPRGNSRSAQSSSHRETQRHRPSAMLKIMREKKQWTWYRLAIGADGTWHSFQKTE